MVKEIPGHLKTQEMCNEAVHMEPYSLEFVPEHFKTQDMCDKAVRMEPCSLEFVLENLKMQEMCNDAVRNALGNVSDHFNMQER